MREEGRMRVEEEVMMQSVKPSAWLDATGDQ
jgi:hypothetical protein